MQNDIIIPCNFDHVRYDHKPTSEQVRKIKMNLGNGFMELPLKEVASRLTNGFSMGFFGLGGKSAKDFKKARQFGIDFDNENLNEKGLEKRSHNLKKENVNNQIEINSKDFMPVISYDEVISILSDYGIQSAYTIKTTSYGKKCDIRNIPLEKFKVFIVTDEVITDPKEAEKCILALLHLFPQADQSGKDLARFTFGTNNGLCGTINNVTIPKQKLIDIFDNIPKEQKPVEKEKYVPKRQSSTTSLETLYKSFPLLDYLKSKFTHCKVKRQSGNWSFTPHPITGSKESTGFRVYDDNTFCDFSNGNMTGNIFNFLVEYEDHTEQQARNTVKELCGIDVEAEKKEWKKQQKTNKANNKKEFEEFDLSTLNEYPFPRELYSYLSSIENSFERENKIQEVQEIASTLKKKREFDRSLKAFNAKDKKNNSEKELKTNFGIKEELNCGHWIADQFGIYTESLYGDKYACYNPVYPIKILHNIQTDKEKVTLRYKPNGLSWQTSTFDRSIISTNSKIMALTDFGIRFTTENANFLCKYLAEMESFNNIDLQFSTSKLGWHNNFTELMPFSESDIVLDIEDSFRHILQSMNEKGDQQKYIAFFKHILAGKRKEPIYMIVASLASILCEPLGCLPFIVHLYGQAGRGKTLCSMVACSVWGDPSDKGFMADPKNTITGFEVHLNLLNNLPFICDDLNKIIQKGQQDHSEFIYMLCSGRGKQRSNVYLGLEKPKTWHNVSITNGEKSITTGDSHGGEMLRTIELEMEEGDIFENGRQVSNFLRCNYGFLGKMFLDFILNKTDWFQIKAEHQFFIDQIITSDGGDRKEGKQIQSMALLMTTASLLSQCLEINAFFEFKHAYDLIYSIDDVSDVKRAYSTICDLIEQNESSFIKINEQYYARETLPNVKWGWEVDDGFFVIISQQFTKLCKEANIDRKLFVKWCIDSGIIDKVSDSNGCQGNKIKGENKWGVRFKTR